MERLRRALGRAPSSSTAEYEPLAGADGPPAQDGAAAVDDDDAPFSWIEYVIFGFLGMAMLWAWNMFLAAASYFDSRFAADTWLDAIYASAILTVSTVTNLGAMLALANMQRSASYPFRIVLALVVDCAVFAILTASTALFLHISPRVYFAFLLAAVAATSWATALIQNGAFAFAASFGRPEYMQALMAGQGVAGVLPSVAQLASVLLFPPRHDAGPWSPADSAADRRGEYSAFAYFLAAVVISATALVAFVPLVRRHDRIVERRMAGRVPDSAAASVDSAELPPRKAVSLWHLFRKLRWLALGVALTFAVTMFFPVFTTKIRSVKPDAGPLFRPAAFTPLAFLFWNLGDLGGRMATMLPCSPRLRPWVLFVLAAARIAQLPLYLLCNIGGRGAAISSDFFYLFVVELLFGLTNGWLGSVFMMASGEWVDQGEREAAGGFMGLCLVIGLTLGSLLSFTVSDL